MDDSQVGARVRALRERYEITQTDLALAMRERGHAWAQATVWNTERGQRPLRYTEAETLRDLIGFGIGKDDTRDEIVRLRRFEAAVAAASRDLRGNE